MISTDAVSDFQQSVKVIALDFDHRMAVEHNAVLSRASVAGALHSGATLLGLMTTTVESFGLRSEAITAAFFEAVAAHDGRLEKQDMESCFQYIQTELVSVRNALEETLLSHRFFQPSAFNRGAGEAAIKNIKQQYDDAVSILIQKQEIATRRALAKLTRPNADSSSVMQNFYGPVGAVISGDQNTTQISQTFNAEGVAALAASLDVVLAKLADF